MAKLEQLEIEKRSRFKSRVSVHLAPTSSHHAELSLGAVRLKPPDIEVLGGYDDYLDDDDEDNYDNDDDDEALGDDEGDYHNMDKRRKKCVSRTHKYKNK